MVRSMTGFGTGAASGSGRQVNATIRTLNHRYLSVRIRALQDQPQLRMQVERAVKQAFRRGEVDVGVTIEQERDLTETRLFDRAIVGEYLAEFRHIAEEFCLPGPPTLSDLVQIGAFQPVQEPSEDPWPVVELALQQAIESAQRARVNEGTLLAEELTRILAKLSLLLERVKERLPTVSEELHTRLQERLSTLRMEVDPARLEMEVVLLAERFDVQEEVARLEVHLSRAKALLETDGAIGKELDFLSQEFLREVNTLGAKSRDLTINSLVVDMKVAIERFKEQLQNVE